MNWSDKAHQMIANEATKQYNLANTRKDGKPYKKHHPYTLPEWVHNLVNALGSNDEETCKAIMMYPHLRDF